MCGVKYYAACEIKIAYNNALIDMAKTIIRRKQGNFNVLPVKTVNMNIVGMDICARPI